MKHDWKFLQEKDSDTQKKMLLPVLVIPLVVIVLMIVIVLADYGKKRVAEPAAVTETVETEVTVMIIMETAVRTTVRTVVTTADLAISSLIRLEIK